MLLSVSNSGANLCQDLVSVWPGYHFQDAQGQIRIESVEPINIAPIVRFLEERNIEVTEARKYLPSLEDVFVQVTGIESGVMRKEKEKPGGGDNQ
jgi:ABC-2 type transport system ATP-binding protein